MDTTTSNAPSVSDTGNTAMTAGESPQQQQQPVSSSNNISSKPPLKGHKSLEGYLTKQTRRQRRKQKKSHEVSWLRDTLSLSTHSDLKMTRHSGSTESGLGQLTRHSGSTEKSGSTNGHVATLPSTMENDEEDPVATTPDAKPAATLSTTAARGTAARSNSGVSSVDDDDELDVVEQLTASLIKDSSFEEQQAVEEKVVEAPIKWVAAPAKPAPIMYERPLPQVNNAGPEQAGSMNERSITPLRGNSNRAEAAPAAAIAPGRQSMASEEKRLPDFDSRRGREPNQAPFHQEHAPAPHHQEERGRTEEAPLYPHSERGQGDPRYRLQANSRPPAPRPVPWDDVPVRSHRPSHYDVQDPPTPPRHGENLIPPWSPHHPPQPQQWDVPRGQISSQQRDQTRERTPPRRDHDLARSSHRQDRSQHGPGPVDRSSHDPLDESSRAPIDRSSHSRREHRYNDPQRLHHHAYPEPAPRQSEYDQNYHRLSPGRRDDSRIHHPGPPRRNERPVMGIPYDAPRRNERYDPHHGGPDEDRYFSGSMSTGRVPSEHSRHRHAHHRSFSEAHNGGQLYPSRDAVHYGDRQYHRPQPALVEDSRAAYDSRMVSQQPPPRHSSGNGRSHEAAHYGDEQYQRQPAPENAAYDSRQPPPPRIASGSGRGYETNHFGDQQHHRLQPALVENNSRAAYDSRVVSQPQPPRNTSGNGTRHEAAPYGNQQHQQPPSLEKNSSMAYSHPPKQSSDSSTGTAQTVPRDAPVLVEISPGVSVPLRRANETMRAVAKDFYQDTTCFSCSMNLFCIANVSFVICPECRVISPVEGDHFEGRLLKRHGLGLGFTCENLFKMQSDILKDRSKYEDPAQEKIKAYERSKYEDSRRFEQQKYQDPSKHRYEDPKYFEEKLQDWPRYGYEAPPKKVERKEQDKSRQEQNRRLDGEQLYFYERRPPPRLSRCDYSCTS